MSLTEVVLRAFKDPRGGGNPDLQLTATDGAFQLVENGQAKDRSPWIYRRVEILADNLVVLVLPTVQGGKERTRNDRVQRVSGDQARVDFHCHNLVGGNETTVGL